MAMIQGTNSKFPCPMCLIPGSELSNMGASYQLHTTAEMSAVLASTEGMNTTDKEDVLKAYGLRDIKVGCMPISKTGNWHWANLMTW